MDMISGALSAGTGLAQAAGSFGLTADFMRAANSGELHGLTPAFKVTVGADGSATNTQYAGISDLGFWSSCKGLKVSWDVQTIKTGNYSQRTANLVLGVKYDNLVLKRGMSKAAWIGKDTQSGMRQWLKKMSAAPTQYDGPDYTNLPNVTITLYDVWFQAVAVWVFRECYPVAWEGPDLDASTKNVALETLTLAHTGWLTDAGSVPSGGLGDAVQGGMAAASASASLGAGSAAAGMSLGG